MLKAPWAVNYMIDSIAILYGRTKREWTCRRSESDKNAAGRVLFSIVGRKPVSVAGSFFQQSRSFRQIQCELSNRAALLNFPST